MTEWAIRSPPECPRLSPTAHVYYGVDETRRAVYIKEFLPLPGGPLDRP